MTTTAPKGLTIAGVKRTSRYKALLAIGKTEEFALEFMGFASVVVDPHAANIAILTDAGFTLAQAREALGLDVPVAVAAPVVAVPEVKALTSKEQADALVVEHKFEFAKGRVYVTGDMVEAIVRVRKTGRPEIVASSGVGHTAAVLLFKLDTGTDVAVQNLMRPASA